MPSIANAASKAASNVVRNRSFRQQVLALEQPIRKLSSKIKRLNREHATISAEFDREVLSSGDSNATKPPRLASISAELSTLFTSRDKLNIQLDALYDERSDGSDEEYLGPSKVSNSVSLHFFSSSNSSFEVLASLNGATSVMSPNMPTSLVAQALRTRLFLPSTCLP
jgi:hypothetical protein